MPLTAVNPVTDDREKGPSALENAAKFLGLATELGGLGMKAYDLFGGGATGSPAVDVVKQTKGPSFEGMPEYKRYFTGEGE